MFKNFVWILLVLSVSFTASAQDNVIGLYTDADISGNYLETTAAFEPVEVYLLIHSLSANAGGGVSGFEAEVIIDGPLTAPEWVLQGTQPFNISTAPAFMVGFGTGDLAIMANDSGVCHLATLTAFVMTTADVINFKIQNYEICSFTPDAPGYAAANNAGILVPCITSSGSLVDPVFSINTVDPVVKNSQLSFGAVKALFN